MNKYAVEFIGTFFLVFTVGMVSIDPGAGALAPLAIGSALAVMIYARGHIAGGHYNPAVTLAVWLRGKASRGDALAYMTAQILAGAAAALVVLYLKDNSATSVAIESGPALVAEFLFTFALAFVVLNVATAKSTEGNSYFGFAIGFTVLDVAYAVGKGIGRGIQSCRCGGHHHYGSIGTGQHLDLSGGHLARRSGSGAGLQITQAFGRLINPTKET